MNATHYILSHAFTTYSQRKDETQIEGQACQHFNGNVVAIATHPLLEFGMRLVRSPNLLLLLVILARSSEPVGSFYRKIGR